LDREELISLSEAAVTAKLHPDHLRKLAQRGQLEAWKVGRNWVTTRKAVVAYLKDSEKRSRDPYKNRR